MIRATKPMDVLGS